MQGSLKTWLRRQKASQMIISKFVYFREAPLVTGLASEGQRVVLQREGGGRGGSRRFVFAESRHPQKTDRQFERVSRAIHHQGETWREQHLVSLLRLLSFLLEQAFI